MARKKLPLELRVCAREGCNNTFYVKVGAKYQKKYCSPRCAALATQSARKNKIRRRKSKVREQKLKKRVYSISELQNLPVNLGHSGGKFAEVCNAILRGEAILIGVD
ncbi:hypothetical protein J7K18_04955 [bacterium]|nr:hypothetical protein [bacterium]